MAKILRPRKTKTAQRVFGIRAAKKFQLVDRDDAQMVWERLAKYLDFCKRNGYKPRNPLDGDQCGIIQTCGLVFATGRARCRLCGEKIEKGIECVDLFVSFTDGSYNPWTASTGKLHLEADCLYGPGY